MTSYSTSRPRLKAKQRRTDKAHSDGLRQHEVRRRTDRQAIMERHRQPHDPIGRPSLPGGRGKEGEVGLNPPKSGPATTRNKAFGWITTNYNTPHLHSNGWAPTRAARPKSWGGGRLHHHVERGAQLRPRQRKTRFRVTRRRGGGGEREAEAEFKSASEEAEGVEEQGARARAGQNVLFICIFLCFFSLADWGEGEGEAPLGRHGSPWVAVCDASRGWDSRKNHVKTTARCHGLSGCTQKDNMTDYKQAKFGRINKFISL